ncbi:MAG: VTT domain-containing protein [Bryobacterales bacterium]|nr:VTT domain-containing protein [Bryobacterales bacterium]
MGRVALNQRQSRPLPRIRAVAGVAGLVGILALAWKLGWLDHLPAHDELVRWMRRDGVAGPLICIGIQFLQVVVFAIPGEITQFAAGYVFGAGWGFVYSIIGILCGSAFDFGFARAVGRPAVVRWIGASKLARIDKSLQSRKGHTAVFALFLLPGAPKDAMSYAAGLSSLSLGRFLALSVPARAPALMASTLFGSQAYDRDFTAMLWLGLGVALSLAGAAYYQWKRRAA